MARWSAAPASRRTISLVLQRFTSNPAKGGNTQNYRVETATNSLRTIPKSGNRLSAKIGRAAIGPACRRLGGARTGWVLTGFWPNAARDYCHPPDAGARPHWRGAAAVSYTHLRAHETDSYLVCRLLLEI